MVLLQRRCRGALLQGFAATGAARLGRRHAVESGRGEELGEPRLGRSVQAAAPRDRRGHAADATQVRGRVLSPQQDERLIGLILARPDATLLELRDALPTTAGLSTLWRAIDRLGLTVKKKRHTRTNNRADVAAARRRWQDWLPLRHARHDVFLDESGITTDLLRRYGRSPRGMRLRAYTPLSHWQTHTVIATLRIDGMHARDILGPSHRLRSLDRNNS